MAIKNFKTEKGVSIIEILIASAIIGIALVGFLGILSFSVRVFVLAEEKSQADALAQEALEIVRNFRDTTKWNIDGIGILASGVSYFLQQAGSPLKWSLNQGTETINGFTRQIIFENVMRDSNDNIVEGGGALDLDTKKVITIISWREDESIEIITYLTNWQ